jgi:hypothetical protein
LGKLKEFKEWLSTLDKQKIFRLLDFTLSSQGLIKGDRVLNTMKKFVPDERIEHLKIKYTATAFDLVQDKYSPAETFMTPSARLGKEYHTWSRVNNSSIRALQCHLL